MHLLALDLQAPTAISCAVFGNFSAPKKQEIVVVKGGYIELLRPDETGRLMSICTTAAFATVRQMKPFRLIGSNCDYLIITSDSGKISVAEFDAAVNEWKVVQCETYGRSGCRRVVVGQYLATDPQGRAVMLGATEKSKLAYLLNRDAAQRLTISSPLQADRPETITFDMCGVDVGYENNPTFAAIELEYRDADADPTGAAAANTQKVLSVYEIDLGLNHIVRSWHKPVSRQANMVLAVPGGSEGPSGVLVVAEDCITYMNRDAEDVCTPLPRRQGSPDKGLLVVSAALHRQKGLFFFLVQTEVGDLYKVEVLMGAGKNSKSVVDLHISTFDTIQSTTALCITKNGLLFAAAEYGNHSLYQFSSVGGGSDAVRAVRVPEGAAGGAILAAAPRFIPSATPRNLVHCDDQSSLAPVTDLAVADLMGEGVPQILTLCGRGSAASLRVLRHGLPTTEMARSELPGRPSAVWTVRDAGGSSNVAYIVVSFTNATLVLSVGETVEEVSDSGFQQNVQTLACTRLADDAMIQVHASGITHIRAGGDVQTWRPPAGKSIEQATCNSHQVVVALTGGTLIYFELDAAGQLRDMMMQDLEIDVTTMHIAEVEKGRIRSPFVVVGCWDSTVRFFSLAADTTLKLLSSLKLTSGARANSVCVATLAGSLQVMVAMDGGVVERYSVDPTRYQPTGRRTRFLAVTRPIKLVPVQVDGEAAVLAVSDRNFLYYVYQGQQREAPVTYDALEAAAGFSSESLDDAMVAISGNTLRIFGVEGLGASFHHTSIPLSYTPRKMVVLENLGLVVTIEADHNVFTKGAREAASEAQPQVSAMNGGGMDVDGDGDDDGKIPPVPMRGPLPPTQGHWGSCVRVVEMKTGQTLDLHDMVDNTAALCACSVSFATRPEEVFIAVGTAQALTLHPRRAKACSIRLYKLTSGKLELMHTTEVEDVPLALCGFMGRLAVGLGRSVRLFELGKKKLLRKCENKVFPSAVVRLDAVGPRLHVGDLMESIHFVRYHEGENVLTIFADEPLPRFTTSVCAVDFHCAAGTDKFGNMFALRLPADANDAADVSSSSRLLYDQGLLNGAPTKADCVANFHMGDTGTAICKAALTPGKDDMLVVATVSGGITAMIPFKTPRDVEFFRALEVFMRIHRKSNLCGRDHLAFRSYYQPVKNVVDGVLCEEYLKLSHSTQEAFAKQMERSVADVVKKIEDFRWNVL